jgi:hypothetical protein
MQPHHDIILNIHLKRSNDLYQTRFLSNLIKDIFPAAAGGGENIQNKKLDKKQVYCK